MEPYLAIHLLPLFTVTPRLLTYFLFFDVRRESSSNLPFYHLFFISELIRLPTSYFCLDTSSSNPYRFPVPPLWSSPVLLLDRLCPVFLTSFPHCVVLPSVTHVPFPPPCREKKSLLSLPLLLTTPVFVLNLLTHPSLS